jgi:hypothetical protein
MENILEHNSLGKIKGKVGDKVIKYLGIKYAALKDRFASAELLSSYGDDDGILDATKLG